jgi:prepilin peptidase CpaA
MAALTLAFAALYCLCLIWAAISDIRNLHIGNRICLILAAAFLPYAVLAAEPAVRLAPHLLVGAGMLALTFGLFSFHWLGGGDAKLIPAIALWLGPGHILSFLVTLALAGGAFALLLLALRFALRAFPAFDAHFPWPKMAGWARNGICPYGVPISFAALCEVPALFGGVAG